MDVETLKGQPRISRKEVSKLLASIGKPGTKREEKLQALRDLEKRNSQGHDLSLTAESYPEF